MKDEHLWPGEAHAEAGTIAWRAVVPALAKLAASTPAILEPASDRDLSADAVTRKAEAAFRGLGELASAPNL